MVFPRKNQGAHTDFRRRRTMNGDRKLNIGFADAVDLVGRAKYRDEWIGERMLTEREEFLITRYVEKYLNTPVPAHTYLIRGRKWVEYPADPALVAEVERARDRMDWREHQLITANQWLNDHGFRCAPIDSDALARELHRCFPQVSVALAKKGGRPPAVDWTVVERETLRLMGEYGEFGPDSPDWNAQTRLEETLGSFCRSKFNKSPARSTIREHITPWLEKWRATKRR
jgi:hypothetical protein